MDYWHTSKKDRGIFKKTAITILGVIIGFAAARIIFISYRVSDDSMEPQFKRNTTVIILKFFNPMKGDAVLISAPSDKNRALLKRIAAAEDDIIEIRSKIIYINGKKDEQDQNRKSSDMRIFSANFTNRDNMPAVKLKRNEYFLINDNTDLSYDSREFGPVNKKNIIGKTIYSFK